MSVWWLLDCLFKSQVTALYIVFQTLANEKIRTSYHCITSPILRPQRDNMKYWQRFPAASIATAIIVASLSSWSSSSFSSSNHTTPPALQSRAFDFTEHQQTSSVKGPSPMVFSYWVSGAGWDDDLRINLCVCAGWRMAEKLMVCWRWYGWRIWWKRVECTTQYSTAES